MSDIINDAPNDGAAIAGIFLSDVDEKTKARTAKKQAAISKSMPIVEDTIAWFKALEADTFSIDNIDLNGEISVEAQIFAYKHLRTLLKSRRKQYEQWYAAYRRSRNGE